MTIRPIEATALVFGILYQVWSALLSVESRLLFCVKLSIIKYQLSIKY